MSFLSFATLFLLGHGLAVVSASTEDDDLASDLGLESLSEATAKVEISYEATGKLSKGEEVPLAKLKGRPVVSWEGKEGKKHTLAMVDPDAPSRNNPRARQVHIHAKKQINKL